MDAEQRTADQIPNHVIEAILKHIPFDGWSTASWLWQLPIVD